MPAFARSSTEHCPMQRDGDVLVKFASFHIADISLLNLPDLEPYLSELKYPKSKNTDFRFLPER